MSAIYYNYFLTCYLKDPPSVTTDQLQLALTKGKLTQEEYDAILASKPTT